MEFEIELKITSPMALVLGLLAGLGIGFLLGAGGRTEARARLEAVRDRAAGGGGTA